MSKPAIKLYNEALDAIEATDLELAQTKVEASLMEDPEDEQTWQLYHAVLTAGGQEEKAEQALAKLNELGLSEVDAFVLKAGQAMTAGQVGKAISMYEDALEIDDMRADLHVSYALALYEGKYMKDALVASAKAVELDPDHAGAHYVRGRILRLTGHKEEALEALTRAVNLDGVPLVAYHERGMLLSEKGELKGALACFEKVLAVNPTDENAITAKAQLLEAMEHGEG